MNQAGRCSPRRSPGYYFEAMTGTDYVSEAAKVQELRKRVEKLDEQYGLRPATWLERLEERIQKLEQESTSDGS